MSDLSSAESKFVVSTLVERFDKASNNDGFNDKC